MIPATTAASFSFETESSSREWLVISRECPTNQVVRVVSAQQIEMNAQRLCKSARKKRILLARRHEFLEIPQKVIVGILLFAALTS